MPVVCVIRPNRKVPRKWTARDVARVATYAQADGNPALLIAGLVLGAVGLGASICALAPRLRRLIGLSIRLRSYLDVATLLNWATIIARFLRVLNRLPKVPFLSVFLLGLSVALAGVLRLLRDMVDILEAIDGLESLLTDIEGMCDVITGG
ncbi:MAG: hypothetical protein L0177_09495 [Chloroflexi bacterium]|nr:hypothetical protein [Chloroflexota bacterium]